MLGLTRTKTHRRAIAEQAETFAAREASLHAVLVEKDAILNSTERNKVLTDLETTLCLIEAYQRALTIASAADPNIRRANAFLAKFNRKGESSATYLGALRNGDWNETMGTPLPLPSKHFEGPTPEAEDRWKQEEAEWGDEAYGSGTVRIEAVPIDEGEDKEPGYTRARIQFVDANPEPEESDDEDLVYADGTEVEKLPEEE